MKPGAGRGEGSRASGRPVGGSAGLVGEAIRSSGRSGSGMQTAMLTATCRRVYCGMISLARQMRRTRDALPHPRGGFDSGAKAWRPILRCLAWDSERAGVSGGLPQAVDQPMVHRRGHDGRILTADNRVSGAAVRAHPRSGQSDRPLPPGASIAQALASIAARSPLARCR